MALYQKIVDNFFPLTIFKARFQKFTKFYYFLLNFTISLLFVYPVFATIEPISANC